MAESKIDLGELFSKIEDARTIVSKNAKLTPMITASTLTEMVACSELYMKLENFQTTGSFKFRGALNAVHHLTPEQRAKGVLAVSAGNHAQGLALAATRNKVKSTICMPITAPTTKVQATMGYGASVVQEGATFDDCYATAAKIEKETGATFVHPFDNLHVIAGQGTCGIEIIEQTKALLNGKELDAVVIPIGGGGLAGGIACAIKHLSPNTKVYGVESEGCPSMYDSLKVGEPTKFTERPVETICDGIAVAKPGTYTYELAKKVLDDVILVDDATVSQAFFFLLERAKILCEPAGAIGLAALFGIHPKLDLRGKRVAVVLSGGNIDLSTVGRLINQTLFALKRLVRISGWVLDRPETIDGVLHELARERVKVMSIDINRSNPFLPPTRAQLTCVLEVPSDRVLKRLLASLEKIGFLFTETQDSSMLPPSVAAPTRPGSLMSAL